MEGVKNFKPIEENKTRVLIMRHAAHKSNFVTPEGLRQSIATGIILRAAGAEIVAVYASSDPRAITTVMKVQEGYGKFVRTRTDDRLTALAIEEPQVVARFLEKAKALNLPGEEAEIRGCYEDPEFLPLTERRGVEGAEAIREIAKKHKGQTVLVGSHGIGRIENAIISLKGEEMKRPERITVNCQIVELILKDGELVEENWLPVSLIPPPFSNA